MLFHMSIAAHDPRHVAEFIAELWGGEAFPFPPVAEGSWVAMAGDERGSTIEIYPIDIVLRETEGDADAFGQRVEPNAFTAAHGAIATPLDRESVLALAAREGWPAKYRKRGGAFGVIELWIEGRQMMEILSPDMQAEYLSVVTIEGWRNMLSARRCESVSA